jgi:hypothetical protein
MTTNLPTSASTDSANYTKVLFNNYGTTPLEFAANEYEYAIGFFESYGFAEDAASVVVNALLTQAKKGYIYTLSANGDLVVTQGKTQTPIFKILDTLKQVSLSVDSVNAIVDARLFPNKVAITSNAQTATTDIITFTFTLDQPSDLFTTDVITVTGGEKGLFKRYTDKIYALEVKSTSHSLQLSTLVGGILNSDRSPTSTLGFKQVYNAQYITRNMAA